MKINDGSILSLDYNILKELFEKARISERKRVLHILRSSEKGEIPAILFNILFPGTYVRPHKHPLEDGKEICAPISGRMKVIIFNSTGSVKETYFLSATENVFIEIPANIYHTIIALEPSVLFELYFGKYSLTSYKEFAEWAPEENDSRVGSYLKRLVSDSENF